MELGAQIQPFFNLRGTHEEGMEEATSKLAKVLYVSPVLEFMRPNLIRGVIAHELAHLVLGHKPLIREPADYDKQENEAWDLVRKWGFEKEAALGRMYADVDQLVPKRRPT